jgi:hypothetical protein
MYADLVWDLNRWLFNQRNFLYANFYAQRLIMCIKLMQGCIFLQTSVLTRDRVVSRWKTNAGDAVLISTLHFIILLYKALFTIQIEGHDWTGWKINGRGSPLILTNITIKTTQTTIRVSINTLWPSINISIRVPTTTLILRPLINMSQQFGFQPPPPEHYNYLY